MPDRAQIIAQVVKVLRLARGAGTEHEAHAALLTAQRLMYKHDISEHEVDGQEVPTEAITDVVIEQSGVRMPWHEYLAAVVAENFRCAYLISTSRSTGQTRLVFVGRSADVEVAVEAYRSARAVALQLGDTHARLRPAKERAAAKESYLLGFLKGLYDRFQESVEKGALMVRTDAEVQDLAASFSNAAPAQGEALVARDAEALQQGHATGYQYGSGKRALER